MATLLRDNPDEYPQAYMQAASLLHVWNTVTLEWDKWDGVPGGTMTVSGTVAIDQSTPGNTNAVTLVDTTGAELDYRQENENWNAADHGILVFGRDIQSTPDKYRALALNTEGDLYVDLSEINGVEPSVGAGNSDTGTLRVVLATNQAAVTIKQVAATATETQVSDTNSSTTILAANSSRLGASVANDSSAALYLRLSATAASTTAYSVRLVQYAYFEVPYGYTGAITGIWASDPNDGAARVTEITA